MADASRPRNLIDRGLCLFAGLMAVLGGLALVALTTITVVSVFWRYVLRDPIFGIEDASTMALTVFVAGAIAWGALKGAHVSVGIIARVTSRRVTRVTDLAARLLGLLIVAAASYALFDKGACGMPCGAMTANLGIVHTPYYYILGLAFGFYAALLAWQILTGLRHWRGTDPNEAHR